MILHLKELMKAMGVTSITLADKVGVSKATVSYWLNGKVFPVPETLEKIADALGVPVWQLFASSDEVICGSDGNRFTAFVRNGEELRAFDSAESLKEYVDGLCEETKLPIHANIRGKEYFQDL